MLVLQFGQSWPLIVIGLLQIGLKIKEAMMNFTRQILFAMLFGLTPLASFASSTILHVEGLNKKVPADEVQKARAITNQYLHDILSSFSCENIRISGKRGTSDCGPEKYVVLVTQYVDPGAWGWSMTHTVRFFQVIGGKREAIFEDKLVYYN